MFDDIVEILDTNGIEYLYKNRDELKSELRDVLLEFHSDQICDRLKTIFYNTLFEVYLGNETDVTFDVFANARNANADRLPQHTFYVTIEHDYCECDDKTDCWKQYRYDSPEQFLKVLNLNNMLNDQTLRRLHF